MRFWDSSALVPLLVEQRETGPMLELLSQDRAGAFWWGTPTECASALARLRREDVLDADAVATARQRLDDIAAHWMEVLPGDEVRRTADLLLRRHPLHAADALQLAAALFFFAGLGGIFVTLDARLVEAAEKEGLTPRP